MEKKWTSLCWLAHLSVRITCCLCWNDNTKKRHKNTDPCRRGFCPAVLLLWIGLLYLVLSVGHGAIERPLLKLEVVHVQLLCEHATWRHSDLVGDGTYPMLLIRHDIKDTHSESALVQRSGNKKHIWHSRFVSCYFLTWWAFFFFQSKLNPPLLGLRHSSVQVSMLWWGCMYLEKKGSTEAGSAMITCYRWQPKLNYFYLLSMNQMWCQSFHPNITKWHQYFLEFKLSFCSGTSFTKYILPSVFVAKFFSKPSWVNSLWFTIQPALLIWWKSSSVTTQTSVCITNDQINICRHLPAHVRCHSVRSSGRTPTLASHWTCRQCGCECSGNKQKNRNTVKPRSVEKRRSQLKQTFTAGGS